MSNSVKEDYMAAVLGILYIIGCFLSQIIPAILLIAGTFWLFKKLKNIKIEDDIFNN